MISKIEGPGSVRTSQPIKRASKSEGASGTSFSKHLDETSDIDATGGIGSAGAISTILGVQEVDDALAHASKGKMRASDILDRLEDLRMELLTGSISKEKLMQLARIVTARRAQVTDPKLGEILDEIDMRAQIELAKYASRG